MLSVSSVYIVVFSVFSTALSSRLASPARCLLRMFKALPALKLFSGLVAARLIVFCLPFFLASSIRSASRLIESMLVPAFLTLLINLVFWFILKFVRPLSTACNSDCLPANIVRVSLRSLSTFWISFSKLLRLVSITTRLMNPFFSLSVRSVFFMKSRIFFFFSVTISAFREALFLVASSLTLFAVRRPFLKFLMSLLPFSPRFLPVT